MARHFQIERNCFYSLTPYCSKESAFSIAGCDYSSQVSDIEELDHLRQKTKNLVLSSTTFEDLSPRLEAALLSGSVRVQISVGAEFQRHHSVVLELLEKGCGLDILIDRPLSIHNQQMLEPLTLKYDVRLCLILNRYFSIQEMAHSLPRTVLTKSFILIVPPSSHQSAFYSADHVARLLQNLELSLPLLIFENVVTQLKNTAEREFFSHFDLNTPIATSAAFGSLQRLRAVLLWLVQRKWILLLDILHSALLFIRHPSSAKLRHLGQLLLQPFGKLKSSLKAGGMHVFHFFRYKLWHFIRYQIWHFLRYRVFQFLRYRLVHFLRYRVPHFFHQVIHFLRYQVGHFILYRVGNFIIYRVAGNAWRVRELLRTLCYPFLKIYWFAEYQFQSRILPLLKKKAEKE